jgi:hypothetical protein
MRILADTRAPAARLTQARRWLCRTGVLALVQTAALLTACDNTWKLEQELTSADAPAAGIRGLAVALGGSTAAVTVKDPAGVDVYERSPAGAWTFVQRILPRESAPPLESWSQFGAALALDGDTLAVAVSNQVGASMPGADDGYVDIYRRASGRFVFDHTVLPSARPAGVRTSNFADSLDLEGDLLVAGSNFYQERIGRVYVFRKSPAGVFEPFQEIEHDPITDSDRHFGFAVDLSGERLAIAQPGRGTRPTNGDVNIYRRTAGAFVFEQKVVSPEPGGPGAPDRFASAIALHGNRLAVSQALHRTYDPVAATFTDVSARVFLFERGESGFTHTFTVPAEVDDYFLPQHPLALTPDALVIGAYRWGLEDSPQAGIVRVYHGSPPMLDSTLLDPDIAAGRGFGIALAASGPNIIVSSGGAGATAGDSAYAFRLAPPSAP